MFKKDKIKELESKLEELNAKIDEYQAKADKAKDIIPTEIDDKVIDFVNDKVDFVQSKSTKLMKWLAGSIVGVGVLYVAYGMLHYFGVM